MDWDEIKEPKKKVKDLVGGESLVGFKALIASLPDALPGNMTAQIYIEVVENK